MLFSAPKGRTCVFMYLRPHLTFLSQGSSRRRSSFLQVSSEKHRFLASCWSFLPGLSVCPSKTKKDYNKKAWSELLLKIRCNQLPSTVPYSSFVVALLGKKIIMHVVYSHSKVSQNYFFRVLNVSCFCHLFAQKFGIIYCFFITFII